MNAAEALDAARAAGVCVSVDGNDLLLEAPAPPPSAVVDLLAQHKLAIMALLRSADEGWSAEDWQVFFDERAGIAEFDGGLPRCQAEVSAFKFCIAEWLNRNRAGSPPDLESIGCLAARGLWAGLG